MMRIPAGEFWMGSPKGEKNSYDDEQPQHKVTIEQDFYMSQTPITQGQWKAVAKLNPVKRDLKENPSEFKGDDNLPVEQVSWYDAIEFCARLTRETAKNYRLPSEAQWEYACRAVSSEIVSNENNEKFNQESSNKERPVSYLPFFFGETITDKLANYYASEIYEAEPAGKYREKTTSVGQFYPNAFGLYDMHGNVWEWCADPWHNDYKDYPPNNNGDVWDENVNDDRYENYVENIDTLLNSSITRVRRGGSWNDIPGFCRSADRNDKTPRNDSDDIGFRVVCG